MRKHRSVVAFAVVALVAAACTSNDPEDDADTASGDATEASTSEATVTTEASSTDASSTDDSIDASSADTTASSEDSSDATVPATTEPSDPFADVDGPAPGVTDDTIKIGVNYVDAEALKSSGIELDLGDYVGAYQAIADDINASGGINGRQLELVFSGISPADPEATDAECTKLTEDEDVFIVTGFFLNDAVMCPLELHDTAVVGGTQNADLVARARAPWITPLVDTDLPQTVTRALAEEGLLDGTIGTFLNARDQGDLDAVTATLDELGISIAEVGVSDAPAGDVNATANDVTVLEQRYKASGVDTILMIGASSENWLRFKVDPEYQPSIVSTSLTALSAFVTNEATTDTSVIDGATAGGLYGPNQAIFEAMGDCVAIVEAAGIEVISPDEAAADNSQAFQGTFAACPHMALTRAWLEAAGPNLNYGTLDAALEQGFEVTLPGDVTPRTYGPAPAADGDPAAYLYVWDESVKDFVRQE